MVLVVACRSAYADDARCGLVQNPGDVLAWKRLLGGFLNYVPKTVNIPLRADAATVRMSDGLAGRNPTHVEDITLKCNNKNVNMTKTHNYQIIRTTTYKL